jgi:hypothetical protein
MVLICPIEVAIDVDIDVANDIDIDIDNNTDVVVVSSTMWRAFELANPLVDYVWNRIFIDENFIRFQKV